MSVRRRRTRLAVLAATAVLGATVPVLGGATSAWACGDDQPAAAAPAAAPGVTVSVAPTEAAAPAAAPAAAADPKPAAAANAAPSIAALPRYADKITAGGEPVEFGVEMYNGGPETAKGLMPFVAFFNEGYTEEVGPLHPEDLVLEVMRDGAFRTIPMKWGCDPTLRGDYSFLTTDLAPNHATRFMFRVTVTPHANVGHKQLDVYLAVRDAAQLYPTGEHFVLPIVRPTTPATPEPTPTTEAPSTPGTTPTKTPSTPAQTPAGTVVAPAAVVTSTSPSPAAVPAAASAGTGRLASTGGGSSSTPMLIGGTTLVLLGAGAVAFAARRRTAGRKG